MDDKCKVLFVCLGNICRSPAAEGMMRRLVERKGLANRFELDSAGFYGGHAGDLPDRRMRVHARQRGLELTHISRQITRADFDRFDWIVAMDDANYDDLRRLAATPRSCASCLRWPLSCASTLTTTISPTLTTKAPRVLSWCSTSSTMPVRVCSISSCASLRSDNRSRILLLTLS